MKFLRGILMCILLFGLAVFSFGCGGGGGGGGESAGNPVGTATENGKANVSGVVRFDGQPMGEAAVYLIKSEKALETGLAQVVAESDSPAASVLGGITPNPSIGEYRGVSDGEGRFLLEGVTFGEYSLVAVKDTNHQSVIPKFKVFQAITTVDVQLSPTGNLVGTVTISGETNLSSVMVYLDGTSYVALTDSTGKFALFNVPAGPYTLRAQRGLRGNFPQNVTVVAAVDTNVGTIDLAAPAPANSQSGSIVGKATKSGAATHQGILVLLEGTTFLTSTDADGNYRFEGVPAKTYTIGFPSGGMNANSSPVVTVNAGMSVTAADVVLTPSVESLPKGGVKGRVVITQFVDAEVLHTTIPLRLVAGAFEYITVADKSGGFEFKQVPIGAYQLEVMMPDYLLASAAPVTITVANPAIDQGVFGIIPARAGSARITGTLVTPINGEMDLFQQGGNGIYRTVYLGKNGEFEFANLPPGVYSFGINPEYGYRLAAPIEYFTLPANDHRVFNGLGVISMVPEINGFFPSPGKLNVGGQRIDSTYRIILEKAGIEYYLPSLTPDPPSGGVGPDLIAGDISEVGPGLYDVSVFSDAYELESPAFSQQFPYYPANVATLTLDAVDQTITAKWTLVRGAESYQVSLFSVTAGVSTLMQTEDVFGTEYSFNNLTTGTQYRVDVTAKAGGLQSQNENSKNVFLPRRFSAHQTFAITGLLGSEFLGAAAQDGYAYVLMKTAGDFRLYKVDLDDGSIADSRTGIAAGTGFNAGQIVVGPTHVYLFLYDWSGNNSIILGYSLATGFPGAISDTLSSDLTSGNLAYNPYRNEVQLVYAAGGVTIRRLDPTSLSYLTETTFGIGGGTFHLARFSADGKYVLILFDVSATYSTRFFDFVNLTVVNPDRPGGGIASTLFAPYRQSEFAVQSTSGGGIWLATPGSASFRSFRSSSTTSIEIVSDASGRIWGKGFQSLGAASFLQVSVLDLDSSRELFAAPDLLALSVTPTAWRKELVLDPGTNRIGVFGKNAADALHLCTFDADSRF